MSFRKSLESSFSLTVAMYIAYFITFIYSIILVRIVSVEAFGMIGMGNTYIEITMQMSTLGSISILGTYTTYFLARKEYGMLKHTLVRYSRIIIVSGVLIAAVTFLFSREISSLLYNTDIMDMPLRIMAIFLLANLSLTILTTLVRASKQFKVLGHIQIVSAALNLGFTVIIIYYVSNWVSGADDYVVTASFVGSILMAIIACIFIIICNKRNIGKLREVKSEKPVSKSLLKFGVSSASLLLISIGSLHITRMIVGYYLDTIEWGYFYLAVIIVYTVTVFQTALNVISYPSLVDAHSKSDYADFDQTMHIILKYSTLLFIPLILVFALFLPYVIPVIWGVDYINAIAAAQVMLISFGLHNYSSIYSSAIRAIEKPHKQFVPALAYVVVTVVFALMFIFYLGILGVAIAMLIAEITIMYIHRRIFIKDETLKNAGVHDGYMKNVLNVFGMQILIILLSFIPCYYIVNVMPGIYLQFIAAFILGMLLSFLSISYIFGRKKLSDEEVERFFMLFPALLRPVIQWIRRVSLKIWRSTEI